MIAVSVLFALAGLFAVGAIIAQRYQRKRKAIEHGQVPPRLEPERLPSVVELSNHSAHLFAEVERKRQASEEAIRKHKVILEGLTVEEAKIRSGIEGESRLDDFLRSRFDDGWTIIAGYRAHEGEIDRILVGPNGVFAFEVKNLGGVIHCDGDRWWRDKTDRYGSVVERDIPIADNGGRSPSRQINDATDAMEGLLRKNGYDVAVVRVIVFSHQKATLGSIRGVVRNSVCEALIDLSTAAVVACDERPKRWASRCCIFTQRLSRICRHRRSQTGSLPLATPVCCARART